MGILIGWTMGASHTLEWGVNLISDPDKLDQIYEGLRRFKEGR